LSFCDHAYEDQLYLYFTIFLLIMIEII